MYIIGNDSLRYPDALSLHLMQVAGALYLNESITVVSGGGGFTCTSPPTEPSTWDLVLLPGMASNLPHDLGRQMEQAVLEMLTTAGLAQNLLQQPLQVGEGVCEKKGVGFVVCVAGFVVKPHGEF